MSNIIGNYVGGSTVKLNGGAHQDVFNPSTGEVSGQVQLSTSEDLDEVVKVANGAVPEWSRTPVGMRAQVMFRFKRLLEENADRIASTISSEHGKTHDDALGEVTRGLEAVDFACGIPHLMKGTFSEQVSSSIDMYSIPQALGVVAGITPFNFPAMVPMWMFPNAIACGNTFILKPSEQDPMTPNKLTELFYECGFPKNVLQLVHGGKEQVDALITHQDTKAISFVGSVGVGQHVYRLGTQNLKRVQSMTGAKNHMVVMPDANKAQVINALVGASLGAAGQRCMAISVAVFVGEAKGWIPDLKDALAAVKPGAWDDDEAAYGPQISVAARDKILGCIDQGKEEGAKCLLDGSNCSVEGLPDGNWVGPTLFSEVTPEMSIYKDEIFGPVLAASNVESLDEALELINSNPFGNGVSIFTSSGGAARRFQSEIQVGQVGINIPIPVPLPFFSFTGWKNSFYGDHHAYGKEAVRFYTQTKTITARWFERDANVDANMTIALK